MREEMMLKAVVVGDSFKNGRPGKAALIQRMVEPQFTAIHKLSIGVDFAIKTLECSNGRLVRLQLWDVAGQDRYSSNITRVYYRDAVIAFIVCDLNEISTFDSVLGWKNDLVQRIKDPNLTIVLLLTSANPYSPDRYTHAEIDQYVQSFGIDEWFDVNPDDLDDEPLHFAVETYLEKKSVHETLYMNESEQFREVHSKYFKRNNIAQFGQSPSEYFINDKIPRIPYEHFFSFLKRKDLERAVPAPIFDINNNNNIIPPAQPPAEAHQPEQHNAKAQDAPPASVYQDRADESIDLSELEKNREKLKKCLVKMEERNLDENVPGEFVCPFTGDIFVMPVTASDGSNYEYLAIKHAIDHRRANNKGLIRGARGVEIENARLEPNLALQVELIQYCETKIAEYDAKSSNEEEKTSSPKM